MHYNLHKVTHKYTHAALALQQFYTRVLHMNHILTHILRLFPLNTKKQAFTLVMILSDTDTYWISRCTHMHTTCIFRLNSSLSILLFYLFFSIELTLLCSFLLLFYFTFQGLSLTSLSSLNIVAIMQQLNSISVILLYILVKSIGPNILTIFLSFITKYKRKIIYSLPFFKNSRWH